MSRTTVLALTIGAGSKTLKELRNSHGSAPVVWNELCKKYYGTEEYGYTRNNLLDRLWPRYKDLSIPKHHRAVLMMTYDRAYISKANYPQAAKDIKQFLEDFPPREGYANHWNEIAGIYESSPDCEAIGLHCTSVSENPFHGEWDEEAEDYSPIDWGTAYEIYTELGAITE